MEKVVKKLRIRVVILGSESKMSKTEYIQETIDSTLRGVITVGSVAGYEDDKKFSLAQTKDIVGKINRSLDNSIFPSIPCMIREEHLVGRAGVSDYAEKLYKMTFAHSPRLGPINKNTFFETLCEYGFRLGKELEQQRVYIDFKDQTLVFKQTGDEKLKGMKDLESKAIKYLKKGRPDWDVPHTRETVRWMNKLVDAEGGNRRLLTSTMWLHDVGYSGLFDKVACTYENINERKAEHMVRGAQISREILGNLGYPQNEISRIAELVSIHDTLESLESPYEIMVMEADVLGQLSQNKIKTTLSEAGHAEFMDYVINQRKPSFRTVTGKRFLEGLLD